MTSQPIRDPVTDHLLTPQNAALIIVDFQPVQIASVAAMDRRVLIHNIVAVTRTAGLYGLPVVLLTVNAKINQPMIPQLQEIFPKIEPLDRTSINSWEDVEFVKAQGHGPQETDHGGDLDRSLPHLPGARRTSRRLRGLSCRRRMRGRIFGGASRGHSAHYPSRR